MAEPTPMLRTSPFCADLRTKKAYFLSAPALTNPTLPPLPPPDEPVQSPSVRS